VRKSSFPHYLPQIVAYDVGPWDRSEPLCIIHFYHSNFSRCAIMDKHMAVRVLSIATLHTSDSDNVVQALAPKYFNTRFLRVFVENVPFLVEKLGLKVLPCVIGFIKGVSKDRYVQWLANARILCLLTLHAGLSASKSLAMWTVLALPPWSSGCCIQVRFFAIKRRDLNI
jgi:hypothetical protein